MPVSPGYLLDKFSKLLANPISSKTKIDIVEPFATRLIKNYPCEFDCLKIIHERIFSSILPLSPSLTWKDMRARIKRKIDQAEGISTADKFTTTLYFIGEEQLHPVQVKVLTEYLSLFYDKVSYLTKPQQISDGETRDLTHVFDNLDYNLYRIIEKHHNPSTETIDYVSGGLLGDFIYGLYVVYANYLTQNKKGNLCIRPILFKNSIDKVHGDLYKTIMNCPYINSFTYDSTKDHMGDVAGPYSPTLNLVNLSGWRDWVYSSNWIRMLSTVYNTPIYKVPWLMTSRIDYKFRDTVLIHRSTVRHLDNFPWINVVTNNKCVFIGLTTEEYEAFEYRSYVQSVVYNNIEECVAALKGCKFFVSNLTSLLAMANALHVPCLAELVFPDAIHNYDMEQFHKEFYWIAEDNMCNFIDRYIPYLTL